MNRKPVSRATAAVLAILQHLLAAACILCALLVNAGQNVVLPGPDGERSYALWESDRSRAYEDSVLFNNIFAGNLSAVAGHVARCTQLENGGEYDADKIVDVTAYVNRGTTLAGDYITARYTVANLLKWAQSGFQYEKRSLTSTQSRRFLADETTWTHIENNAVSGGMNSYLNAQIEGNVTTFTTPASPGDASIAEGYVFYEDPDAGGETEHNILINRYRTADGKNIENIVSNWSDYQALCDNVTNTARSLYDHYEKYLAYSDYYRTDHSSMRYYIMRSIGGRQEIYTNVDSLQNATSEEVGAYFGSLTKSLYYCPYDMAFSTDLLIGQDTVREMFSGANSAFYPDQIRVYAGVDLDAGITGDDFALGGSRVGQYLPTSQALRAMAAIFGAVWFLLLVLRILVAGHVAASVEKLPAEAADQGLEADAPKTRRALHTQVKELYAADRMPFEGMVILWVFFTALFILLPVRLRPLIGMDASGISLPGYVLTVLAAILASAAFSAGLLSVVRRYKAGRLPGDSLLYRAGCAIGRLAVFSVNHANLAVRTLLPGVLLILVNLLLPALASRHSGMTVPACVLVGAADLITCYVLYRNRADRSRIIEEIERISAGGAAQPFEETAFFGENRLLAHAVNDIGLGIEEAVNTSMQDERLKTELITNVSHDIKTPLTSIINYVDLLKREEIDNPKARDYIRILEEKSAQLGRLTEDLVEASKISSGAVDITFTRVDLNQFVQQSVGEYGEMLQAKGLEPILRAPDHGVFIQADAHHLWRVMENLFGNACKYSLENTRVYLDLKEEEDSDGNRLAVFSIRNVSKNVLQVDPGELTERFIRGDVSRSSEGSGLGLSIADNLVKLQGGVLSIDVDGDLFKVTITFALDV